jgi:hypothetical protein
MTLPSRLARTRSIILAVALSVTLLLVVPLTLFLTLRHSRARARSSDPEALLPVVKLHSRDPRRVQMEMQVPFSTGGGVVQGAVQGAEMHSVVEGPAFGTGRGWRQCIGRRTMRLL